MRVVPKQNLIELEASLGPTKFQLLQRVRDLEREFMRKSDALAVEAFSSYTVCIILPMRGRKDLT